MTTNIITIMRTEYTQRDSFAHITFTTHFVIRIGRSYPTNVVVDSLVLLVLRLLH